MPLNSPTTANRVRPQRRQTIRKEDHEEEAVRGMGQVEEKKIRWRWEGD